MMYAKPYSIDFRGIIDYILLACQRSEGRNIGTIQGLAPRLYKVYSPNPMSTTSYVVVTALGRIGTNMPCELTQDVPKARNSVTSKRKATQGQTLTVHQRGSAILKETFPIRGATTDCTQRVSATRCLR